MEKQALNELSAETTEGAKHAFENAFSLAGFHKGEIAKAWHLNETLPSTADHFIPEVNFTHDGLTGELSGATFGPRSLTPGLPGELPGGTLGPHSLTPGLSGKLPGATFGPQSLTPGLPGMGADGGIGGMLMQLLQFFEELMTGPIMDIEAMMSEEAAAALESLKMLGK